MNLALRHGLLCTLSYLPLFVVTLFEPVEQVAQHVVVLVHHGHHLLHVKVC